MASSGEAVGAPPRRPGAPPVAVAGDVILADLAAARNAVFLAANGVSHILTVGSAMSLPAESRGGRECLALAVEDAEVGACVCLGPCEVM